MEEQCTPLAWAACYYQQEGHVDALKQSLLYSTLELEAAVISAHDEISRKDDEILQLKSLLSKIIKERDDFQANSRDLALQKQLLFHQLQALTHSPDPPLTNDHDHHDHTLVNMSPSDQDININVNNVCKDTLPLTPPPVLDVTDVISLTRPLPELGKFHQAVMEAGPLLQTLLLAGPLPRWQHPPPQLNSVDIPPVTIPTTKIVSPTTSGPGLTNKRGTVGSEISPSSKYQKVCSPIDHQHTS